MRKCTNCGVILRDPVTVCPLCKCVAPEIKEKDLWGGEPEPSYPFADRGRRRTRLALRIYLYAALVAFVVCILAALNYHTGLWWALVVGACLGYGYVLINLFISKKFSGPLKLVITALLGFLVVVLIDYHAGPQKWSFDKVLPVALIGLTAVITIMTIQSKTNWQSYISLQIMMIALALIPFGLYRFGLFSSWRNAAVVLIITILPFIGTLLVGGRAAQDELARRFHI